MARAAKAEKTKKTSKKSKDEDVKKKRKTAKAEKAEKPAKVKKSKRTKDEDESPKSKKSKKGARAEKAEKTKGKKVKAEKTEKEDRKSKKSKAKDTERKKKRGKSEDDDEEDEAPAKGSKKLKRKKLDEAIHDAFNPYGNIDDVLDTIDKDLGLGGSSLNLEEARQHTGSLVLDLVVGKGLTAGWYTSFGPEQSCKSTGAMTMLIASLMSAVPILSYWDYEGSGQPDYIGHMLKTYKVPMTIHQVFGEQDPRTSKWITKPRVRYQKPQVAEKFFDYIYKLEKRLPDKICVGDKWYYVYEDTKDNRKLVGDQFDKNYWRTTKKLRVPAKDGTLQALAIVDSYPAMLGEKLDEEDKNAGMAAQARMFSEQLRRVKGRMSSKRIAVVGVNQLRQRPGVMYGSPEYEPCGDALKYFSDCRLRFSARALSSVPYVTGKGQQIEEPSVTVRKAKDLYRFIHVRGIKNKLGMPYMEGWLRLWIKDGNEEPRGFDPVWDTFMYLDNTGQISHKGRKKMTLKIKKHTNEKPMEWLDFKMLILGTKKQQKEVCEKYGLKWFDLREFCIDQIQNKDGMALFIEHRRSGGEKEEGDEDNDDDTSADDSDDED